jgi:cell division protein FtsB
MSRKRYLLLGIIAIVVIFFPGYARFQQLKQKHKILIEHVEKLKQENRELEIQIERLEKDPFYIEKRARDKMGIGKEGEIRYRIEYKHQEAEDGKSEDQNR